MAENLDPTALMRPLVDFYLNADMPLPPLEQIDGADMPEPHRSLLVHQRDMTPTLEHYHGATIHLRVIQRSLQEDILCRQVALYLDGSQKPVEYGAIRIYLDLFSKEARLAIMEGKRPLGSILHDFSIDHKSLPRAYFRVEADDLIRAVLELRGEQGLYGRRNTLWNVDDKPLAEIVEILP